MRRMPSSILSVVALAVALVVALILISNLATSEGTSEVGREGQTAIAAEAALSAASSVQNAAAFAVVLEQGRATGQIPVEVVTAAARSLAATTDEYERRVELLTGRLDPAEADAVAASSTAFVSDARDVSLLLLGDPGPVAPRVPDFDATAYDAAAADLAAVRDSRVRDVLIAAENVGQVADAVRFLIVVVIPVVAMLLFRSVFRRRRERDALEVELAHQRELSRQKDQFLANLSHELKTPLTGIYGFALTLEEEGLDDPEMAHELTGHIITEAGELSRMVDDLITAGQIESGKLNLLIDNVDVDALVESVVDPYVRSGHAIEIVPGGCTAEADERKLQQIVRSLVSNAVRHGGEHIEVFTEYGSGTMSLFVMDDGDGIDDETREKLFERYVHDGREPLLQGSVGLGLAIARSLAVAMGGSLSYTRTNGLTYFVLKLPAHRVSRLHERIEGSGREADESMYDTQQVAKLFSS